MNINNADKATAPGGPGAGLEVAPNTGPSSAANAPGGTMAAANPPGGSVSSSAAAAILQNNGLRKSMQGSTAGLRSLQTTMSTNNQLQQ